MTKPVLRINFDPPEDMPEDQLIEAFAQHSMDAFVDFLRSWRKFQTSRREEE
jgi:predicted metal-dependent phosphoesterase TrpH